MKAFYAILPLAMAALISSAADQPGQGNQGQGNQGNQGQGNQQNQNAPHLTEQQRQENAQKPLPSEGNTQFTFRQRMVTGQVMDTKEADITTEGKSENHLLAKVKTYTGHVVIVDLGTKSALKNDIKNGDEIAAFGVTGRLNERPLVVASKVATIQPIQGREDILESIPASYMQDQQGQQGQQRTGMNNQQFNGQNQQFNGQNPNQQFNGQNPNQQYSGQQFGQNQQFNGQNPNQQFNGQNNQQFTQEAIRRSNENDRRELEGFQGGQPNQQGYIPGQQPQQQYNANFDRQGVRTPCEDR